jgi:hypothetical protein
MIRYLSVAVLAVALSIAVACGGNGGEEGSPTKSPSSPTPGGTKSPTPEASAGVSSPEPNVTATPGGTGESTPGVQVTERPGGPSLSVESVSSPVAQGAKAAVSVKTDPKQLCALTIVRGGYQSPDYVGTAPTFEVMLAEGLAPVESDASGRASWSWQMKADATPDTWKVTVFCGLGGVASSAVSEMKVVES